MTEQNVSSANRLTLNPDNPDERLLILDERRFATALRKASTIAAAGDIIPKQFQNNPGATMVAMNMAERMGTDPLFIMQSLHVIHGKPAFSSKFLIALVNSSAVIDGELDFEFDETQKNKKVDYSFNRWVNGAKQRQNGTETLPVDLRCRAIAKKGDKVKAGAWVSLSMAITEGWYHKDGSKWQTMPELMLQYRAASFWQGVHAPQLSLGMATTEEAIDITPEPGEIDITPAPAETAAAMLEQVETPEPVKPSVTPATVETETPPPTVDPEPEIVPPEPKIVPETQETETPPPSVDLTRPIWVTDTNHDAGGYYTDHSEPAVEYNPALHGWSRETAAPAMKSDGTFKKKRGAVAEPETTPPPVDPEPTQQPGGQSSVDEKTVDGWRTADPFFSAILTHINVATTPQRLDELMQSPTYIGFDDERKAYLSGVITAKRAIVDPAD